MRRNLRTRSLVSRDPRKRLWGKALSRSALDLLEWGRDLSPTAWCNICGWRGQQFRGGHHSEAAHCPCCRSVARDRFLYACWTTRRPWKRGERLLETSPRLGSSYRRRMRRLTSYLSSDFDQRGHKGSLVIDLQDISMTDASLDVVLTTHTLEHVPDPDRALRELHRVLAPGGTAFIMVPLPQGLTRQPEKPEFHGDNTPVHWRFGWDLGDRIRHAGFTVTPLVTADLLRRVREGDRWGYIGDDADSDSLLSAGRVVQHQMVAVVKESDAQALWLQPSFYFVVWECRRLA